MTKYECDRCEKQFGPSQQSYLTTLQTKNLTFSIDLCQECMNKLRIEFMKPSKEEVKK